MNPVTYPLRFRFFGMGHLPLVTVGLLTSNCILVTLESPVERDSSESSGSPTDAGTPGESDASSQTPTTEGPSSVGATTAVESPSGDTGVVDTGGGSSLESERSASTFDTHTLDSSSENGQTDPSSMTSDAISPDTVVDASNSNTDLGTTSIPAASSAGSSDTETVPPTETGCSTEVADPTNGVFVSTFAAGSTATCGTLDEPCASISVGIERAIDSGKPNVYVRQGNYPEQVTLDHPIALSGGWVLFQGAWQRECGQLAVYTTIQSPTAIGLRAEFVSEGTARIQALTIRTKGPDGQSDGESRYGIFARGVNTRLELTDVTVAPGAANTGARGADGVLLASPACAVGSGANGEPGETPAPATSGTFTMNGYVPSSGDDGGDGAAGDGGSNGSEGSHACTYCSVVNGNCQGVAGGVREASGGTGGCGGPAGSGGKAGTGGGASIGMFTWEAQVEFMSHVTISAGNGGDAGAGGLGANGGAGAPGTSGAEVACNSNLGGFSCPSQCYETAQGAPGGKGGDGGSGANGSAGAGGSSFALVAPAGAVVGADGADLSVGAPGASWGDSPAGLAQLEYLLSP